MVTFYLRKYANLKRRFEKMVNQILLESIKIGLKTKLVESSINNPCEMRCKFFVAQALGENILKHPGLSGREI
jgi:hypothetical protein